MVAYRSIPAPPQKQALKCNTFRPPPLDGSLSLPELYDWHLVNTPHHRLFIFANDSGETRTIYWPKGIRAIYTGAHFLRRSLGWKPNVHPVPIVTILAASDSITYFTMIMATLRAGYIGFPISPRNSPAAVVHLIKSVGVQYVLVGREKYIVDLADGALEVLKTDTTPQAIDPPELIEMPIFQDLFLDSTDDIEPLIYERRDDDEIVLYMHSSSSTAYPKPIPLSMYRVNQLALIPYFGEHDLTDKVFSIHAMPIYHAMGFLLCSWAAACGTVISAFEPKSPAQVPTPDNLLKAAVATNSDIIFCVPALIEAWTRNPESIKWLASRLGILYGGGPLNKATGDYMTSQGVSIFTLYGSTEGGVMSPIIPVHPGYDWDYFKFPSSVTAEMVPHDGNTYELVIVMNSFCHLPVVNTQVNAVDAYATSDLLTPHPTKPGYWRIYGRADDQIMHNTGEKTNPGPLENTLSQDPHVKSCVMFGRGHFQAGILVDPKPAYKFNPSNQVKLAEFRNFIWPTIQKMNKFAPQHSRLFKEMIMIAKPDKPFEYTAKSTARRQAIIKQYNDEIEALYNAVETTTQTSMSLPSKWDVITVADFVRGVVNSVLVHKVVDNDDIFHHGCDSLQVTWIRNTLARALRDGLKVDIRKSVNNFVYEYPSIESLATFVVAHTSEEYIDKSSEQVKKQAMLNMVEKYSTNFRSKGDSSINRFSPPLKTVLVTGTTGGLGCSILSLLFADQDVERIYCLNRPSAEGQITLTERQKAALDDKGLSACDILDSPKVILLEGRLEDSQWGLLPSLYEEIHQSATHIIHNAWPVDFNLALKSFEPNVKGLRNLINFALSSPLSHRPAIIYASTLGIFQNTPLDGPRKLLETHIGAEVAIGSGYTESKWVSEQILAAASTQTGLRTVSARVGQLSGGPNGYWNSKEWLPSLVQSANLVSCLPNVDDDVSWLPLQLAAQVLIDLMRSSESGIAHVVHPRPTPWSQIAAKLSSELAVPLVPYHEWLSKLEHAALFHEQNPHGLSEHSAALRLLNFFRMTALKIERGGQSLEAFAFPRLSTENTVSMSPLLSNSALALLTPEDAGTWLQYWRSIRFV